MAWTIQELVKYVSGNQDSVFHLFVEDGRCQSAKSNFRISIVRKEWGEELLKFHIANAFVIAQEWANRQGVPVRLVLDGSVWYESEEEPGLWENHTGNMGIKTFNPVDDGRKPAPLSAEEDTSGETHKGVHLLKRSKSFERVRCFRCNRLAEEYRTKEQGGLVLFAPACKKHLLLKIEFRGIPIGFGRYDWSVREGLHAIPSERCLLIATTYYQGDDRESVIYLSVPKGVEMRYEGEKGEEKTLIFSEEVNKVHLKEEGKYDIPGVLYWEWDTSKSQRAWSCY